jgi:hypothetical protein
MVWQNKRTILDKGKEVDHITNPSVAAARLFGGKPTFESLEARAGGGLTLGRVNHCLKPNISWYFVCRLKSTAVGTLSAQADGNTKLTI